MAGILQEEHPFSLIYKIFFKMCLFYMKKVLKRVSKIACFLDPNYGRLPDRTGVKSAEQRLPIKDHGSWIMDYGSRIMDQRSKIKYQGSDQGSLIKDHGSSIKDPGSWIKDDGSWIKDLVLA